MLSKQDTLRRLQTIRHSSAADRIRKRSITFTDVAKATSIPRQYLHEIASEKVPLADKAHAKLSDFFECQEMDEVRSSAPSTSVAAGSGSFMTVVFPPRR